MSTRHVIKILVLVLLLAGSVFGFSQKKKQKHLEKKPVETRFIQADVLDSLGEISRYNDLVEGLGGDSLRYFPNGEKLQGWKEDYYQSGQLLHKGFYKNGQLELFKNFWENGKTERVLARIDSVQINLEVYFENGNQRRQVNYYLGQIKRYSEFYPNGLLKRSEEYDSSGKLLLKQKTWFSSGQIESELFLQDQKSKKYKLSLYHPNGKLAESGIQYLSKNKQEFIRSGVWTLQDSTGKKKNKSYSQIR